MRILLFLALGLLLPSCAPVAPAGPAPITTAPSSTLTPAQKMKIGRKIWQNESGGTLDGLTHWNAGEEFPSLGIGHFIWYPRHFQGRWAESFPRLIRYALQRGAQPPAVARQAHSPWNSRAEFQAAFHSAEMVALRQWLASTVTLQTDHIIATSQAALPKILTTAPPAQRARLRANYHKVASTPNGLYALIDYVNFKGDGTKTSENYHGEGWGLRHVLAEMRDVPAGQAAAQEFAAAARRCLDRRIANSPPARGETRWRAGWHNRTRTYAQPF